jgi:hypothetical protein
VARIIIDQRIPEPKREPIKDAVRTALGRWNEVDSVFAVVSSLPSGRLTVWVNHIEDPKFLATLEATLARL